MIRAGELREAGIIEQPASQANEFGRGEPRYEKLCSTRFRLRGLYGRESAGIAQVTAVGSYEVQMRWRRGINATMRIVHNDGRIFNIVSAQDPDGRRIELILIVTEAV